MIKGMQSISLDPWDVKGAATEASLSDNETPASAAFKAPQSLEPSPHMPTQYPMFFSSVTSRLF
jgi:hypothetical protein